MRGPAFSFSFSLFTPPHARRFARAGARRLPRAAGSAPRPAAGARAPRMRTIAHGFLRVRDAGFE
jgi:hypothetical protein